MVCCFCAVNITGGININFVQISISLNKTKTVEISRYSLILKAQKKADPILEMPRLAEYVLIINSRILILRLSLQINATKFYKDKRRLATVMFHGTPCILEIKYF